MKVVTRNVRTSALIAVIGVLFVGVLALGQGKKSPTPKTWALEIMDIYESTLVPDAFPPASPLYEVKDLDTSLWFNAFAGANVEFQQLAADPLNSGTKLGEKVCGFPDWDCEPAGEGLSSNFPLCMTDFLNNKPHPYTGYSRILFRFFYPSGLTTQTQAVGTKVPVQHWRLYIEGQNLNGSCGQCSECERHTITGDAHGYLANGPDNDPDMYIERTGPDTWEVNVNTRFDNPDFSEGYPANPDLYDTDKLRSDYCVCEEVAGSNPKRPAYSKISHNSAWTRTPMKFKMRFTRF